MTVSMLEKAVVNAKAFGIKPGFGLIRPDVEALIPLAASSPLRDLNLVSKSAMERLEKYSISSQPSDLEELKKAFFDSISAIEQKIDIASSAGLINLQGKAALSNSSLLLKSQVRGILFEGVDPSVAIREGVTSIRSSMSAAEGNGSFYEREEFLKFLEKAKGQCEQLDSALNQVNARIVQPTAQRTMAPKM